MDFLMNNYLWFIVGGIVIIMITIGFIAERTDFGRKPFSSNKDNNKEKNIVPEIKKESNPAEEVAVIPETDNNSVNSNIVNNINFDDGLNDIKLQPDLNVDVQIPSEPLTENIQVEEIEAAVENVPTKEVSSLEQPEVVSEVLPVKENDILDEVAEVENNIDSAGTADDVWKF